MGLIRHKKPEPRAEGEWKAGYGDSGPYGLALPGLDDGVHDFHAPEIGQPDGLCPLCNNERHREYDRAIVDGEDLQSFSKRTKFGIRVVERHAALHVWPLYSEVFKKELGDAYLGGTGERGAEKYLGEELAGGLIPRVPVILEERIRELYRSKLGPRGGILPECVEKEERRYTMDGAVLSGAGRERPLAAWDDSRMSEEIAKRTEDALNFYDEMLAIRKDAMRIYDEIMSSGNMKYYSTAIAAVRERRGIVETLGKMSLIAKQLSDETEGKKKLSPSIRRVVDSIFKLIPEDDEDEAEEEADE